MKPLRTLPERLFHSLRPRRQPEGRAANGGESARAKGQSLLRLHEYQHRVILEIFRVSIAGFFAFTAILLAFALYALSDPYAPAWLAYVIAALAVLLMVALVRTVQEFRTYRRNYEYLSEQLRAKAGQQGARSGGSTALVPQGRGGPVEQRVLAALKPREHTGWDSKACRHCGKAIDMGATSCPHCGQEQGDVLLN